MSSPRPTDELGHTLCAWLDAQLPAEDARNFEAVLADDPELRSQADDYRRTDALVRAWYTALTVPAAAPPTVPVRTARPWFGRRLRLVGLAGAAAVLIVALLNLFPPPSSSTVRAADVVGRTGRRADAAPGLLATFRATIITPLATPDAQGNREERRTATGEIRFGPLSAAPLWFRCRETWAATDEEPELVRTWGQTVGFEDGQDVQRQWLREKQGRSVITRQMTMTFDPNVPAPGGPLAAGRDDGSPVDVRTRQAVEGLATLVRGFKKDAFQQWMGYDWQALGGQGTTRDPWIYRVELGAPAGVQKGVRTTWTLRLVSAAAGIIDHVELEETVRDLRTRTLLSSFQTVYTLQLRTEPWPATAFDP